MIFSLATKKVQLSVPVIERSKPKSRPDQRKEIEGAKTIEKEKEAAWKRLILIKTIRAKQKRRMLKKVNDEILREALDDSTVTSGLSVPKTLEEALPDDIEKRNNDPRAIVVTEASGSFNMIGCNKAWENLCGFTECEVIGKDSSILQGPDTNYDGLHDAVSRLFEGEPKVRVVSTNYRKDGSSFTNLMTISPLKDASGKVTHFCAILNDISGKFGNKKKEAIEISSPKTLAVGAY
ncbi:hypothetical protein ACHAXN_003532 [Cyclotella atomus]